MHVRPLHLAAIAAVAFLSPLASAAVTFNEIGYDMPSTDDGKEFVELRGTPGESLNGLSYITIEADAGGNAGVVEQIVSLDGLSIGSNGLLLIRDSDVVLQPAPAAGTTVTVRSVELTKDLENDSNNHFLVRNLSASVTAQVTDLDADDDGSFDASFWDATLDSFTVFENNGTEVSYASSPENRAPQLAGFLPDFAVRLGDGRWVAVEANNGNAAGTGSGPYRLDNAGVEIRFFGTGELLDGSLLDNPQLTPGNLNPSVVPEPAALAALAGVGGLSMAHRRRP